MTHLNEWAQGFVVGLFGGAGGFALLMVVALALYLADAETKYLREKEREDKRG